MADPKSAGMDWLVKGTEKPAEKTRMQSREQKEYYDGYIFVAEILDLPWLQKDAERDMVYMESFKGKRSDDIVEVVKGTDNKASLAVGIDGKAKEYVRDRQGTEG